MSDKYNILFTPFNIGKQQIKNRFIMGPMGCNQMYDSYGALNNDGIAYYTERAKGGFGAVFLGVAMVDNLVDNYPPTLVENPLYAPGRYKKMASMLVEIKSRSVLPHNDEDEAPLEDPRQQLVEKLLEYKKYKSVVESFQQMEEAELHKEKRGNILREVKALAASVNL